ncbi:RBM28-like protein [Mya arenaria]|uniref:RBM28-like protein n=1 Tax=Mya arenaria TaxID=6604 RepID=A0ABY7EHC2_MYAAR|nr:RBM28-like protein [Mya arenaria]
MAPLLFTNTEVLKAGCNPKRPSNNVTVCYKLCRCPKGEWKTPSQPPGGQGIPIVVGEGIPIVVEESIPIVVEESIPKVVEESIPIVVGESIPIVVEESIPIVVEESIPIVVEESIPIVVEESIPIVVGESIPIVVEESIPIVVGEGIPIVVGESIPIVVGEGIPIVVGKGIPIVVGEGIPIVVGEGIPIVVGEGIPICNEEGLRKAFQHCGEIIDIKLPTNTGRPVAVDWALPKAKYQSVQQQENNEESDKESDDRLLSAESEVSSDEEKQKVPSRESNSTQKRKHEESDDEGLSPCDSDEADDDEDEDVDKKPGMEYQNQMTDESESDADNDGDTDDEEEDDKSSKKRQKKTKEDGLHKFFSQFGALQYAKVVINQNTEHSKGMGFVRFKEQDSADKCLAEGEAGSLSLDGRQLILSKAVSREAAAGFKDDKEKEKKDNRNLYLAREGLIRPGTQAAEGLSKADLDKRIKVEELKRHKLKNINIFISPLRLCVRNIPATVDDQQLRKIFKDAAGGGNVNERLIVEFSQENRKALEIQAKRRERIQSKQSLKQTMKQEMGNARRAEIGGARRAQGKALPLIHMADKDRPAKGEKQPKGLPSHWGPKIRHKARPSQELATKKARQERKQGRGSKVAEAEERK